MDMKYLAALGLGAIGCLAALPGHTQGSQNCAPRAVVVEHLATKFGESRQMVGLGGNTTMVEVFASTESGTWSIIVTRPDGITCLVASGQSFEAVADAVVSDDEAL